MVKQNKQASLRISGPPDQLATIVSLPTDMTTRRSCSVEIPGITVRHARVRSIGGAQPNLSMLKLKLPRDTPPGSYQGMVALGGEVVPISVEVEAHRDVRLIPDRLEANVRSGERLTTHLWIVNDGNLNIEVAAEYKFCIFEESGINRALFVALAGDEKNSSKRIDRLLDELADSHGGRVKLQIAAGSGNLSPGDARELVLNLTFADRLKAGKTYSGVWKIENAGYFVRIETT